MGSEHVLHKDGVAPRRVAHDVAALDAQKMGALFLPPDASANGRNRKKHLDEMQRDWERVRERGKKVAVSFAETRTVVRTTMVLKEGANPARAVPIELEVVATDAGWRIAAMRYLSRGGGGQ